MITFSKCLKNVIFVSTRNEPDFQGNKKVYFGESTLFEIDISLAIFPEFYKWPKAFL